MKRKLAMVGLVALLLALAPTLRAEAGVAGDPSQVYVVHGIDLGPGGTPVDVCVNEDVEPLLRDFVTGDVAGPVDLPEGDYDVRVYFADPSTDCTEKHGGQLVVENTFAVPAGANLSIVAYAEGPTQGLTPALEAFVNDVDCTSPGEARVTARHTANAPEVDVLVDGSPVVEGLANGEEAVLDVPAGSYDLAVEPVGTDTAVVDLPDTALAEAVNTIAYVIGGVDSDPLYTAVVQAIDLPTCEGPSTTVAPESVLTPAQPVNPAPSPAAVPQQTAATFTG